MKLVDADIGPRGKLTLQVIAMPRDTNPNGDIYAGWLMEQMDLAGVMAANKISKGRTTTVAMERVEFLSPVSVGDQVSCYTEVLDTGRSSIKIKVEVFMTEAMEKLPQKVTETTLIYVAINDIGGIRQLPSID